MTVQNQDPNSQRINYPLLFLTGSVTLSLEVLASRIMTPYFGASLYIWASILCVTLSFLAIGYGAGGWLTRRVERRNALVLFLCAPCCAASACGLAAGFFPILFPWLALHGLILSSFIAAFFLLAVPLIVLSAMNPLLVFLNHATDTDSSNDGDGGAGTVFLVSTFGSVFGVLVTAFVFIGHLDNHAILLVLAVALCLAVIAAVLLTPEIAKPRRQKLMVVAGLVALCCGVFLGLRDTYLSWLSTYNTTPRDLRLVETYPSAFGAIKVLTNATGDVLYVQDGMLHNQVNQAGVSVLPYTHILERLGLSHRPNAKSAMVLGLAGGSIPKRLADQGLEVSVVDIDSRALTAAQHHFGFDPTVMTVHIEDARTLVQRCSHPVDIVVVDLFHGDGTPEHLLSQAFFSDLKRCLMPEGVVVINILLPTDNPQPFQLTAATLRAVFPYLAVYDHPNHQKRAIRQAYFVARMTPPPLMILPDTSNLPPRVERHVSTVLQHGRIVADNEFAGTKPAQDAFNIHSVVNAQTHLTFRSFLVRQLPPMALVN